MPDRPDHRRNRKTRLLGQVQQRRNDVARPALEGDLLDHVVAAVDGAGGDGVERRPRRQGIQPQRTQQSRAHGPLNPPRFGSRTRRGEPARRAPNFAQYIFIERYGAPGRIAQRISREREGVELFPPVLLPVLHAHHRRSARHLHAPGPEPAEAQVFALRRCEKCLAAHPDAVRGALVERVDGPDVYLVTAGRKRNRLAQCRAVRRPAAFAPAAFRPLAVHIPGLDHHTAWFRRGGSHRGRREQDCERQSRE